MTRHTPFKNAILERDLGDDFLQFAILASQVFDFVTRGCLSRPLQQRARADDRRKNSAWDDSSARSNPRVVESRLIQRRKFPR
jgi:hypothetical protein